MTTENRRAGRGPDRRRVPRGGRRATDRPGRFPNLLVADAYEGARIPCARYLDHFGFRVEQASDGKGALEAIRATSPHLMLVDVTLPNGSGHSLRQWLDQDPQARSIPVIALMSDFDAERTQPKLEGLAGVLVKPFPLATMLEEVRRALRTVTLV